ncbi:MAG: HNH endonuclease, partial [Candidatus Marinimicrobia bacterium]|nr:HNH endonuclease [Candidatus Neomarinimicrobiota bacterium]
MRKNLRNKILAKYDSHCAYCGIHLEYDDMQVDHIVPIFRNDSEADMARMNVNRGADTIENMNPSCRSCNATKSTYSIKKFRKRLIEDVYRLRRDSSKFRILERFGVVGQLKT